MTFDLTHELKLDDKQLRLALFYSGYEFARSTTEVSRFGRPVIYYRSVGDWQPFGTAPRDHDHFRVALAIHERVYAQMPGKKALLKAIRAVTGSLA